MKENDLVLPTNPFSKLEKEQEKEEAQRALRKGWISLNDFIDVLKRFEFRKTDKDLVLKFLKAINCYFQLTETSDCVYYLKLLRQMVRRVSNYNKLTTAFEHIKPIVSHLFVFPL